MAECERTAHKIAMLPALGVKMTKLAVNQAMEGRGFLASVQHNLELMTIFDTTMSPEQEEFNAIRHQQGLRAALAWRDARFKDL